jgi:hypothetical protein
MFFRLPSLVSPVEDIASRAYFILSSFKPPCLLIDDYTQGCKKVRKDSVV